MKKRHKKYIQKSRTKPLKNDHAQVITRAEWILLGFIFIGIVLHLVWPVQIFSKIVRIAFGLVFFISGSILFLLCYQRFYKAKTTVSYYKPTQSLVTNGPYKYMKHPMYVSRVIAIIGFGFFLGNIWIILMLIPSIVLLWYGVMIPEERYLEHKFEKQYRVYKNSIRLWF